MRLQNTPSHSGTVVKDGDKCKFVADNKEFLQFDINGFEGLRVELSLKESKRSDEFNRYYWGVVVKVTTDFFNQEKTFSRVIKKEFVHEILCGKFLGFYQQTLPGGEIVQMRQPSRDLTQKEFYDFVKYCKTWMEELFNLKFPDLPKQNPTD